jgi:hypothetical protein
VTGSLRILVSGMTAGVPYLGGATWAVLQYLLGLRRLGHDVWFVEPVRRDAVTPQGAALADSENAGYFRQVVEAFGLGSRAALLTAGARDAVGVTQEELLHAAHRADVLLNISGTLREQDLLESIPVRIYLDLDPAFTQLWQEAEGIDMGLDLHTHFATVGLAIGSPGCSIPTLGRSWVTSPPPVVLDRWLPGAPIVHEGLTTVGNWRGYGSIEWKGTFYGQKAHAMRGLVDLPTRTSERFMPAFAVHPDEEADLVALRKHGWVILDPTDVAGSPARYAAFVRGSKAELGVAKSGYVVSRSGWFSDRSACYLAAGRPVVAQQTGFGAWLPPGKGLLAFETAEDVLEAIDSLNADYPGHARAAREIAEEYLDSDRVLDRLLAAIGVS